MKITLPLVLTTGLLDSLNPCAISLLLIYIGLLFSLGKKRETILVFGFFYILSVYVVYFLIGIGILKTFVILKTPQLILKIGAILSIIFGILNIKEYFFPNSPLSIRMPYKVRQKANDIAHKANIPAAITLGALVGASEFPCSGVVYITILSYLQAKESFFNGIIYLLIYNLVFVFPLIIIYLISTNRIVVEKITNAQERLGRKMHLILAAVMISFGAAILIWFI